MGYVRELKTEERDDARRIALLKDRHSGTSPISESGLNIILNSIGDQNSPRKIFGYFEDEKLVSWLAIRYLVFYNADVQLDEKVWMVIGLYTSDFHNHFSFKRPETGTLFAHALNYAEATGYYTYIYSIAARLERVYEKQWAKQSWKPMTGRYDLITIGVVPANTDAPTEWQRLLMGGQKPDDIVFKKRVLKHPHRSQ